MGTRQQGRPQRRRGARLLLVALVSTLAMPAAGAALPRPDRAVALAEPGTRAFSRPSARLSYPRLAEVARALPREPWHRRGDDRNALESWDRLRATLGGRRDAPRDRLAPSTLAARPRRVSRRDAAPRGEGMDRRVLRRWQRLRGVAR
ncbi:MAG: hypothetical protein Q9Q40_04045 [Acidobacteriota bacterium]|nr:hypothetical protein [Acidobacteriota bacterium]MDQ7088215.1 hypothetical protein [Acidobacteriota bacterium]